MPGNPRWRLAVYALLTQAILLLGRLRAAVVRHAWLHARRERTFDVYAEERWSCCDCGLEHDFSAFQPGEECQHEPLAGPIARVGHAWPVRPSGYGYRLRLGAEPASLARRRTTAPLAAGGGRDVKRG